MTGSEKGAGDQSALIAAFKAGKRAALARAISVVEDGRPGATALLRALLSAPPSARRYGFTGPPGAGKSSLVAGLVEQLRREGEEVAVVAVDPTSPFSGGALLGDRIRMNDLATDPGVFIRSMATRGSMGGVAAKTREVVDLMDAFGFPNVFIETVGVGQTELEIASAADTVAVVLVPESGDAVQAMKAGLMEIADLFIVNKADRPGADRLVRDIRQAFHLRAGRGMEGIPAHHGVEMGSPGEPPTDGEDAPPPDPRWEIPVLKTSAGRGEGIEELLELLRAHARFLRGGGGLEDRRRRRAYTRIRDVLLGRLDARGLAELDGNEALERWITDVAGGAKTPYGVVDELIPTILRDGGREGKPDP